MYYTRWMDGPWTIATTDIFLYLIFCFFWNSIRYHIFIFQVIDSSKSIAHILNFPFHSYSSTRRLVREKRYTIMTETIDFPIINPKDIYLPVLLSLLCQVTFDFPVFHRPACAKVRSRVFWLFSFLSTISFTVSWLDSFYHLSHPWRGGGGTMRFSFLAYRKMRIAWSPPP